MKLLLLTKMKKLVKKIARIHETITVVCGDPTKLDILLDDFLDNFISSFLSLICTASFLGLELSNVFNVKVHLSVP